MIKIFLADDDLEDCQIFELALAELNLKSNLTIVYDGEQLLHLLRGIGTNPDIVFLDLNMPRKNGFESLKEIMTDDELKDIPVVIYSTSCDQASLDILYNAGAHYFIRKPSEFSDIKLILEKALLAIEISCPSQPERDCFVLAAS